MWLVAIAKHSKAKMFVKFVETICWKTAKKVANSVDPVSGHASV